MDIKTVSSWLGHSTAKLTLDTYGHLMGTDAGRAALDRVNTALRHPTGTRQGSVLPRIAEFGAENNP
ncbi:hypothetical protein ASG96_03420 [Terrabacter sp. Soil810]|nr:hypothetical protein ASD90_18145 [Terrabacter sp. Root181]KRF47069.1 hypothetical protein ASG96_03420 [Terrabacter sp. Soil810]